MNLFFTVKEKSRKFREVLDRGRADRSEWNRVKDEEGWGPGDMYDEGSGPPENGVQKRLDRGRVRDPTPRRPGRSLLGRGWWD